WMCHDTVTWSSLRLASSSAEITTPMESRQPLLQVAVEGLPVRADGSSGRGELAMGAPLPVRG
ncbi:hypothetical protein ACSDR0_49825, partial [Streptosporangium sp. G11]|uniref:hypothetical protein n=1 Tax=Streptosporangium sp. G11 TaxID=3436926 RepID=UPI003EB922DE